MDKPTTQHERTAEEANKRPAEKTTEEREERVRGRLPMLCLAVLGVVYGDIGTSPLYALRDSFTSLEVTRLNVLGVLSLLFWSLILVVSLKYMAFVMRADNHGEGGILALMALISPWRSTPSRRQWLLIALGLFGAALLYGDGMITPAITVLSAVEGLHLAAPALSQYLIPLTIVIVVLLFFLQKRGTGGIGRLFGPIMLVWFAVLALLGVYGIVQNPAVLTAINPLHAFRFFMENNIMAFLALGGVVLAVTGAEALYADMGHFGRSPIRLSWFIYVLPALTLNYLGQGAMLLGNPQAIANPFYSLAPDWALYPLIALTTVAACIASQAVISGVFSLTHQAVELGMCPRVTIVQTSPDEAGQIYVPVLNWVMLAAVIGLVVGFGSAEALAAAYGVAITATMVITTLLMFALMRRRWNWPPLLVGVLCAAFLIMDLAFFGANLVNIPDGGWFPLLVAGLIYLCMETWRRGRELMRIHLGEATEPLSKLFAYVDEEDPVRIEGSAVFLTARADGKAPPILLHHLRRNRVLHERVVLLTVHTEDVPRVPTARRLEVEQLEHGFWRVRVRYGFMQSANVPVALRACERHGLDVDLDATTFYLGRQTVIPTDKPGMMIWREVLFAFMSRNSARATQFYRIPPEQVVELGIQVEL
ncbi:MAG: potassium transporter Kup [Nitrococcus sp.]|nr:potassium transporter Kup [Nitrococcus sp.]